MQLRPYITCVMLLAMLLAQLLPPTLHVHLSNAGSSHTTLEAHLHPPLGQEGWADGDDAGPRAGPHAGHDAVFPAENAIAAETSPDGHRQLAGLGVAALSSNASVTRQAMPHAPPACLPDLLTPSGAEALAFDALAPPQANG